MVAAFEGVRCDVDCDRGRAALSIRVYLELADAMPAEAVRGMAMLKKMVGEREGAREAACQLG